MFDQFGWDLHYLLPERIPCAALNAEFWFLTSFFHRTTKRRRRNNVLLMSPLSERSVARHVTVLERLELVSWRPLTFLKVMSTLFWLKFLKHVTDQALLKYHRSIFCATSTNTSSLARGWFNDQRSPNLWTDPPDKSLSCFTHCLSMLWCAALSSFT